MNANSGKSLHMSPCASSGRALIIALFALAALLGGLIVARGLLEDSVQLQAASVYPETRLLEPFELSDAQGNAFTEADLQGNLTLLFFGFTNCPDICPDTLGVLAEAMDKLDAMRVESKPHVVFVSVDPGRDAGRTMQDYVAYFDPDFTAVTGDDPALNRLTSQVGAMFARNSPDENGYYAVDHSGMIVIVDDQGRMIGRFPTASSADAIAADLFALSRARG
ncbi:MAG: SCO family protein [Wenzhouxiangellaceae bacterium]